METKNIMNLTKKLDTLFARALSEKIFSGAAVGLSMVGNTINIKKATFIYGHTEGASKGNRIESWTFFDLASLTKPLVTSLSLLALIEEGKIGFTDPLKDILPGTIVPQDKADIILSQLTSHSSGLPAHRNYFPLLLSLNPKTRKEKVLELILREKLLYPPGKNHVYSDLGYMLLGMLIEQQSKLELQEYWQKKIATPLGLQKALKFPYSGELDSFSCAVTETCPWAHKRLCGVVHDDNCRAMGGIAGHAGLFGTVEGVLDLCTHLCCQWRGISHFSAFSNNILRQAVSREDCSMWTRGGFDTPSKLYSSSGKYYHRESVGHLGFTGTSFWIDLKRGISIILLTNRVYPSRDNERKIKKFRPRLHDLLMKELV